MNKIIIYKKDGCPHCNNAIETLKKYSDDIVLIDIGDENNFSKLKNILPNAKTVPQIFINNEHIGGNDDLQNAITNGKFDKLFDIEFADKEMLGTLDAVGIIKHIDENYGENTVFTTSFGAEDQVISHMIFNNAKNIKVVTLDTKMLFDETIETWNETEKKYNVKIQGFTPNDVDVQEYINEYGKDAFYNSIKLRRRCCHIRKIAPLEIALSNNKFWITGIRSGQAETRANIPVVQNDTLFGKIKINPLHDWDEKMVWDYIKQNNIPFNSLHNKGYPSIGCKPCTRAIKPGEDIRAGRWWWESPEKKECGLHK